MNSQGNYIPMTAHNLGLVIPAPEPKVDGFIRASECFPTVLGPFAKIEAGTIKSQPLQVPKDDVAIKADDGKVDVALVPPEAIIEIAKAFTFGAKKYAAHNWRKGFKWMRVLSALLRHVYAWMRGEDKDPESGLSHLAHAGACVCFLLAFEVTGTGEDDRFKTA